MKDKLKILIQKKQRLDSLRPVREATLQQLEDWLKVELTYSSNAIEGNTLTRRETAEVIDKGVSAVVSGKPLKDLLEARNHAKALEFVKELAKRRKGHQFITEDDIKAIHKIILTGIEDDWAGVYRQMEVFIRGSNAEFPMPQKIPSLMKKLINWLQSQQETSPVRVASDAHFKFVTIHPFKDGNGRAGRLLMNLILILNGYPMAIIRNEERTQYLATFDAARNFNNMMPFYDLIETSVERSLDAYINAALGKAVIPSLLGEAAQITEDKLLKIGELAKLTHETVPTIRYWTNEGLLKITKYSLGGYQLYDTSQVDKAKEIRYLQDEQRLTIAEIKQKLGIRVKR
jgi:Fic family protein